jgi:hypothetical protein
MPKRENRKKVPISVEFGARAEAEFELKGEIPSNSLGRLVDALTDAIRPFTERRGLRADQIRLQRAEVAVEIAKLAQKKIDEEQVQPKSVPNKILVPLIERSSNEELTDKFMIDRWSDLLVSASIKSNVPPLFVQILDQMDGRQARVLSKLMLNEYEQWNRPLSTFYEYYEIQSNGVGKSILRDMERLSFKDRKEAYSFLIDWFNRPGCYLYAIEENNRKINDDEIARNLGMWYEKGMEEQLELCCVLGVLKMEEVDLGLNISGKINSITTAYYHLTNVGVNFLECCARCDLAKLESQQKEKDELVREHLKQVARGHFPEIENGRMPNEREFYSFLSRWNGSIPAELQPHVRARRKVTRCRLSNTFRR